MNRTVKMLLFTAVIFLTAVLFSCENNPEEVQLVTSVDTLPEEIAMEVELIFSDSAKVKLIISAPKLERYSGDSNITEFPDGVRLTVYNRAGEVESTLDAKYGRHFPDEKSWKYATK